MTNRHTILLARNFLVFDSLTMSETELAIDALGPFSVAQLRDFCHEFPPTTRNGTTVCSAGGGHEPIVDSLKEGRPVIVLWLDSATFGHFILLFEYEGMVELWDPLGSVDKADSFANYMDDPNGRNGGGLRPLFQRLDQIGVPIIYNPTGPQPQNAQSCGLHCMLRSAFRELSPEKYKLYLES